MRYPLFRSVFITNPEAIAPINPDGNINKSACPREETRVRKEEKDRKGS